MQTPPPSTGHVSPSSGPGHRSARPRGASTGLATVLLVAITGCTNVSLPVVGTEVSNVAQPPVATAPPVPDARGVITFPTYQAVRARSGDTVDSIASRLGINATALAKRNGLPDNASLREGELLLLPEQVAIVGEDDDLAALASSALDRADGTPSSSSSSAARPASGSEPVQHTVARGETAYSIARLYNVSVRSLADWNGLPSDYTVREDQVLLIPVVTASAAPTVVEAPGTGSTSPQPPSASSAQPDEDLPAAAAAQPVTVAPLGAPQTAASDTGRLAKPVSGSIIRGYDKSSDAVGVVFSASAGATVRAAEAGTVVAITRDVNQVPVIVVRHPDNLLSVYANVDAITVAEGDTVQRGQKIAVVPDGDPSFLHFEVLDGVESVDPVEFF